MSPTFVVGIEDSPVVAGPGCSPEEGLAGIPEEAPAGNNYWQPLRKFKDGLRA